MNAIFYKEWIKTRWYLLLAAVVTLGFTGYAMLRISRVIDLKGAAHLWGAMLSKDSTFIGLLEYIPLIVGGLLAIVQMMPEMHRKCLKLTLHLPYPGLRMVSLMLAYGVVALAVCFALGGVLMWVYLRGVFAPELYSRIFLTAAPWGLSGIAAYLLLSWTCLEPTWRGRVGCLVVSVLVLRVFFLSTTPLAYCAFLPWLALFTLLTASLSWLSIARFKAGKQD